MSLSHATEEHAQSHLSSLSAVPLKRSSDLSPAMEIVGPPQRAENSQLLPAYDLGASNFYEIGVLDIQPMKDSVLLEGFLTIDDEGILVSETGGRFELVDSTVLPLLTPVLRSDLVKLRLGLEESGDEARPVARVYLKPPIIVPTKKPKSMDIFISFIQFVQGLDSTLEKTAGSDFDAMQVYHRLQLSMSERMNELDDPPNHPNIRAKIRSYQKKCISWALARERGEYTASMETARHDEHTIYWQQIDAKLNGVETVIYLSMITGEVRTDLPDPMLSEVRGGVIAEEMGMGKSLEVLSLILLNPLQNIRKRSREEGEDGEDANRVKKLNRAGDEAIVKDLNPQEHSMDVDSENVETQLNGAESADIGSEPIDVENDGSDSDFSLKEKEESFPEESVPEEDSTVYCYCAGQFRSRHYVQCESCNTWQHMQCVGFNSDVEGALPYICPDCSAKEDPLEVRSTLIVCPAAILSQWKDEMAKHFSPNTFRVGVYKGVSTLEPKRGMICRSSQFAEYDIVLCTYETASRDLHHDTSKMRSLARFRGKKYRTIPTPLTKTRWHRLCMDESQMFGTGTSGAAQLLRLVPARHRWAVSGTPVQKGLNDLHGLLVFLGIAPYDDRTWWNNALVRPFNQGILIAHSRLDSLLRRIMWRNSKSTVDLNLPPQTTITHRIAFSEVETFIYEKEQKKVSSNARQLLSRYQREESIPAGKLRALWDEFLHLRQLCDHPQLTQHSGFVALHKSTLTMEELLVQLLMKAKVETEDSLRQYVMNTNGLAACHVLKSEFKEALLLYQDVLKPWEVRVDRLPSIHAIHNTIVVLEMMKNAELSLTDDLQRISQSVPELVEKMNALREIHIREATGPALLKLQAFRETEAIMDRLPSPLGPNPWWLKALEAIAKESEGPKFIRNLIDHLRDRFPEGAKRPSVLTRFSTVEGLRLTLYSELEALKSIRIESLKMFNEAVRDGLYNPAEIKEVMDCGCGTVGKTCRFCKMETKLEEYRSQLFLLSRVMRDTYMTERPSEVETIFNYLAQAVQRIRQVAHFTGSSIEEFERMKSDHANTIQLFDTMKKELKQMRGAVEMSRYVVYAQNEIEVCVNRIRFARDDEPPQPDIVHRHELETRMQMFSSQRIDAEVEYRNQISQMRYLENLQAGEGAATDEDEGCPICREEFGSEFVVWTCGHRVCPKCMETYLEYNRHRETVRCPKCRSLMNKSELTRVFSSAAERPEAPAPSENIEHLKSFPVNGSWGSKVDTVIRLTLSLREATPGVKIIVFSQWGAILDLIAKAFAANSISFVNYVTSSRAGLEEFKQNRMITALLLPIRRGANGLNLIEATHVFLIEPSVNVFAEAQAIGRVHRIGQTKPTFVHRLLITGTVEERMANLSSVPDQQQPRPEDSDRLASGFHAYKRDQDLLAVADIARLLEDSVAV